MLPIGEFARRGGVTVRMLRHYHKIGLLVPAEVDGATGYRFYSEVQLGRLSHIVVLKDLGFSLSEVRGLMHELDDHALAAVLRLRRHDLAGQIERLQGQLRTLDKHIERLESEAPLADFDIGIRSIPEVRAIAVGADVSGQTIYDVSPTLSSSWQLLTRRLSRAGIRPTGRSFVFLTGSQAAGDRVIWAAVPVGQHAEAPPDTRLVLLPAVETAATTVWRGAMGPGFPQVYERLQNWIDEQGYEYVGGSRDIFINPMPDDGGDVVIKVQWPVRRPGEPMPNVDPVFVDGGADVE